MKLLKYITNLNVILYTSIFIVTQITGLLFSLVICFILQDFIYGFIRIALINSFILGLSLLGSCSLTQKLMFKIRIFYIAAISFSLILGVSIISFLIVFYSEPTLFIYYDRGAFSFLFINFLFTLALYIIGSGLMIYREITHEKEKTIENERYLKNRMEMQLLSSKLNPHFLFNTLNMIIILLKQPEKAEHAILNLADLLRENLEQSDKPSIEIVREIENVRKYLELQKLRFGDKLHYEIKGNGSFSIPPLIVQPLVENCIKHNIQNVKHLDVEITIDQKNINRITIIDSEKRIDETMLGKGNGLSITKKRVENANGVFLIDNGGITITF